MSIRMYLVISWHPEFLSKIDYYLSKKKSSMTCLLQSLETTCMCGLMYILHLEIFNLIIEFHSLNVDTCIIVSYYTVVIT